MTDEPETSGSFLVNTYKNLIDRGKGIVLSKINLVIILAFIFRIATLGYYVYRGISLEPAQAEIFWADINLNLNEGLNAAIRIVQGQDPYAFDHDFPAPFPLLGIILLAGAVTLFPTHLSLAIFTGVLEIAISLMVYFALKAWNVKNPKYLWVLFLFNPFWIVKEFWSFSSCGYHISDLFFTFFLIAAMWAYPQKIGGKENGGKRLSYVFLGLSVGAKLFTLPVIGLIFLKDFIMPYIQKSELSEIPTRNAPILAIQEKLDPDFKTRIIDFVFLIIPAFFSFFLAFLIYPGFFEWVFFRSTDVVGAPINVPLIYRLIAPVIIFLIALPKIRSMSFPKLVIIGCCITISFTFWNNFYLRYFAPLIPLALLLDRNHILNWMCIVGVAASIPMVYFGLI